MNSSSLDITHCWTTLVMECLNVPWAGNTGRRRQEGHPIIVMDNKQGQTMSRVACYHRLWTAYTIGRCRAWHAIMAIEQHIRSDDVGRGMPSSP